MDSNDRSNEAPRATPDLEWLRSSLGVLSLFASLGVGLRVLAFGVANSLKSLNLNDPAQANVAAGTYLVGALPLIDGPILVAMGGFWAGTRTRLAGTGRARGRARTGPAVAAGFGLGANAAGIDVTKIAWPTGAYLHPCWRETLADVGTDAGVLYLVATTLVGARAGATSGALTDKFAFRSTGERDHGAYRERRNIPRV